MASSFFASHGCTVSHCIKYSDLIRQPLLVEISLFPTFCFPKQCFSNFIPTSSSQARARSPHLTNSSLSSLHSQAKARWNRGVLWSRNAPIPVPCQSPHSPNWSLFAFEAATGALDRELLPLSLSMTASLHSLNTVGLKYSGTITGLSWRQSLKVVCIKWDFC